MSNLFKPEKINWRHYFGGFGFVAIVLQLITGLYLIFFFEPTLKDAYKTVQYISNQLFLGSLARNLHRWISALLFIAIIVHTVRCTLRWDFLNYKKRVLWMTGVLLLLPVFLFTATGLIVPWEWKGYFFMEMVPNYFESLPVIGPALKDFFLQSFTIPRYYVFHVVVLPLVSIVLIDYHILSKLRRRGIFRYLLRHSIATLPLIVILFVLATKLIIPTNDPIEVPMPLEGEWVLAPEWYFLTIMLPLMYLKGFIVPLLAIILPLLLFFGVAFMPYYLKNVTIDDNDDPETEEGSSVRDGLKGKIINGVIVTVISLFFVGLLTWGNFNSPTLGCNSCHNVNQGIRMGIPPEFYKERSQLPHLNENDWMMKHWYYPNEVW